MKIELEKTLTIKTGINRHDVESRVINFPALAYKMREIPITINYDRDTILINSWKRTKTLKCRHESSNGVEKLKPIERIN